MLSFAVKNTKHNHHRPYTITVLSPVGIFTCFLCVLVLFALLLVLVGLAGVALGPILLWMGWSLLKFAAGMLLLLFLARIVWRLLQSFYRLAQRSSFAAQASAYTRPWLLLGLTLLRRGANAFWRWYRGRRGGI